MLRSPFLQRMRLLAPQERLRYLRAGIDQHGAEVDDALDAVRAWPRELPVGQVGGNGARPVPSHYPSPLPESAEDDYGDHIEDDVSGNRQWSRDDGDFPNGHPKRSSSGRGTRRPTSCRERVLIQTLDRLLLANERVIP
jgi:hypothetical protein